MSQATLLEDSPMTVADFDLYTEGRPEAETWELVAGRIVAMTNPSRPHGQIVANLGAPLKPAMDRRNCQLFFGGMGVQFSKSLRNIDRVLPDLLVHCGAADDAHFVTDPAVVIEVLSPSTIDYDRGDKLAFYKRLPPLRHILLVYQDQMRIEHYRRAEEGWELLVMTRPADVISLVSVGFDITLEAIYAGVAISAS